MQQSHAAYFERPLPIALVLGVFAVGVVPLALLQLVPNFVGIVPHLMLLCAVGLGTSHFFLTLAVYLSRTHLAYFASTKERLLIYFGLPLAIFAFLAWIASSGIRDAFPREIALLFAFIRLLDFYHVGRQSFGMLQLWKRPLEGVPAWTRGAENTFFVGAAAMQWQTFWVGGQFPADRIEGLLPAAALAVLFVAIATVYGQKLAAGGGKAAKLALAYFVIQAICSAAAVYRTWLYLTVLAVHYLEYHVIMYPRCFTPEAQNAGAAALPSKPRARVIDWLRERPLVFYALLAPLLPAYELRNTVQPGSRPLAFLIHVFDGIFVVHYVMDAFLWRFGNPFYRQMLGPLYFGTREDRAAAPNAPASDAAHPAPLPQEPRRSQTWALGAAVLALVALGAALATSPKMRAVEGALIDPIHAQNHLRWGIELAQQRDFRRAKQHLQEALKRNPASAEAKNALLWVEQQEAPMAAEQR